MSDTTLGAVRIRLMDRGYTSLAFTETGLLFAVAPSDVIGQIDPLDGSTVSSAPLSLEIENASITSDGSDALFLMTRFPNQPSVLNALDPVTGVLFPVGSTGISERSFNIAYIPEPDSVFLLLLGISLLLARISVASLINGVRRLKTNDRSI